jgi:hypothetical protein
LIIQPPSSILPSAAEIIRNARWSNPANATTAPIHATDCCNAANAAAEVNACSNISCCFSPTEEKEDAAAEI